MSLSLLLFQKIAQLFLMMLMGWGIVKAGLVKTEDSRVLSVILVYIVTPCVIFRAFMIDDPGSAMKSLLFTFVIAIAIHLFYILVTALLRKPLKMDVAEQASVIYTNGSFLAIPLVQSILGEEYVMYTCGYIVVLTVLLWTHNIWMISGGTAFEPKKLLTNVNLLASAAAIVMLLLRIHMPALLSDTMASVAASVGPLGMFLGGMIIAGKPLGNVFRHPRDYGIGLIRLLVYPAIVVVVLSLLRVHTLVPDGKNVVLVVLISAVAPSCTTSISQIQLYGKDAEKASRIYILTTLAAIITMPLMIGLYDMLTG